MVNLEQLRRLYNFGRNLTLADVQVLLKAAKTRSYQPGELLIKEGSLRKEVFMIRKGLVRGYKVNHRGDEITTMLRWEDQVIASPNLVLFDKPAEMNLQAIEPTHVFCIDYDVLQNIISKTPKLEANRKYILQNILKEALERIDSFILLSPEERYLDFIASKPNIVDRAPDKYIANILGITPVSLSRIRKRIAERKK